MHTRNLNWAIWEQQNKHLCIIEKFSMFFCEFNGLFSRSGIKSQSDSDFFASYGRWSIGTSQEQEENLAQKNEAVGDQLQIEGFVTLYK